MKFIRLTDVSDEGNLVDVYINKDLIRYFKSERPEGSLPHTVVEFVTGLRLKVGENPKVLCDMLNRDIVQVELIERSELH